MIDLILNPTIFQGAIIALAVLTPLLSFILKGRLPKRCTLALGAFGPYVGIMWIVYNGLIAALGFASVSSVLITLAIAIVTGLSVGFWIRPEFDPVTPTSENDLTEST